MPAPPTPRRSLLLAALLALSAGAIALVVLPRLLPRSAGALPRPAPARAFDPITENARCIGCHSDIAAEWRGSQHQTAFIDPAFQRAYALEPAAFCRGCHAPESPAIEAPSDSAAALGAACITCHLAGQTILAAPKGGLRFPPHRVDRSAAFAADGACAGCHEFSFGDDERRERPLGMQRTISEHAASSYAETSCADCHMPFVGEGGARHRSHAFASTRDPESHRRAVSVRAERVDLTSVRITLTAKGVGHAYPTGDLFRRVVVRAEVVGDDYRSLSRRTIYLRRQFALGRDINGRLVRVEAADSRLSADGAQTLVFDLGPKAAGLPITYEVALERVLHTTDDDPDAAALEGGSEGRVVLASGAIPTAAQMP